MTEEIRALLDELKAGLETLYAERLRGVYLYGSHARGEADSESDVDVLVVLNRIDRYGDELGRTSHLVAGLSLKYGTSVSRVFVTEGDWVAGDTPFLVNAREEAVVA
mgnify:CR=1 FL=1